MLLFHYSTKHLTTLKTLEKQGKVTKEEIEKEKDFYVKKCKLYGYTVPGYYYEHISFFFEKPPLDIISSCFDNQHPVWYKGNTLYEYTVDSNDIKSFLFEIVESPEKTELMYNDKITDKEYYKLLSKIIKEKGYVGKGSDALERAVKNLSGTVRDNYIKLKERPNYNEIKEKYAATVPHIMLYPILGEVKPIMVKKITIP